jgi:hypothetical protein
MTDTDAMPPGAVLATAMRVCSRQGERFTTGAFLEELKRVGDPLPSPEACARLLADEPRVERAAEHEWRLRPAGVVKVGGRHG